jgi:hypothetical protein
MPRTTWATLFVGLGLTVAGCRPPATPPSPSGTGWFVHTQVFHSVNRCADADGAKHHERIAGESPRQLEPGTHVADYELNSALSPNEQEAP